MGTIGTFVYTVQAGVVEGNDNRGVLDVNISYMINEVDSVLHRIFGCEIRVRSEPISLRNLHK